MHKVKFMDVSEKQQFTDKNQKHKKNKKKSGKTIKIEDSLFETSLRKVLIKKTKMDTAILPPIMKNF